MMLLGYLLFIIYDCYISRYDFITVLYLSFRVITMCWISSYVSGCVYVCEAHTRVSIRERDRDALIIISLLIKFS